MKNRFLFSLGVIVVISFLLLSPQLELPWMLIDDGENLRMGQEISKHFDSGDYSWILSYEKVNGRFRPAYWLWHLANYKTFGFNSFGHHLGHLFLYMAISTLIFLITQRISRSNLAGILAVVFFLFFYPTAENYYRLGTAEPPLVFLYLLAVYWLVRLYLTRFSQKNSKIRFFDYLYLFITFGFTYFMKESAFILIIALIPFFLAGLVDLRIAAKKEWIKFFLVLIVINLFFFSLTLFLKNYYGISGGYTEAYIPKLGETISRFVGYLKMIAREYRWVLVIPAFTFTISVARVVWQKKKQSGVFWTKISTTTLWQVILIFWFLLFLAVQAPWLYVMGRYLVPVTVWLAIFMGIEYSKIFLVREKFLLKASKDSFSFKIPVLKVLAIILIAWLISSHGRRINQMYQSALSGERFTQNLVKYLATNTPTNGSIYANFSEGIMEYLYELPLHFRFFYARPDIKVDYLYLEKQNTFKKGDFVITFKEHVQRYPLSEVREAIRHIEEIDLYIFGPSWHVLKFKEEELYNGTVIEKIITKS